MSVSFVCPICKKPLQRTKNETYLCQECGQTYPQTMGIPNLCGSEVVIPLTEVALVKQLLEMYPTATYEELALARIATRPITEACRQEFVKYTLSLKERGRRFYQMFQNKLTQKWSFPRFDLALDVGCGIGTGLLAMAREFDHVVGLDIRLSALIVARKLLESEEVSNVTLVQGSVLRLPFHDGVFSYTTAINVLEHVFAPTTTLTEIYRILTIGGIFAGDSRNRYDLLFPEPHVGLRWVGFLPRKWMESYIRWRLNVDYDHTYLLSYGDLKRALTRAFGTNWRIVAPDVSAYGWSDAARQAVEWIDRTGPLQSLLVRLLPTFIVLARRTT